MAENIQIEKSKLLKRFEQVNDIGLINAINGLLDFAFGKDKKTSETNYTLEEYNKEIQDAEDEISKGLFYSQNDVRTKSDEWKKRP